jgi:cysteine desulfurase/selenocysteine lyase
MTKLPIPPFDVERIRADFPILDQMHHDDVPLVFLDNAASSQKPLSVIQAMDDYYRPLSRQCTSWYP